MRRIFRRLRGEECFVDGRGGERLLSSDEMTAGEPAANVGDVTGVETCFGAGASRVSGREE